MKLKLFFILLMGFSTNYSLSYMEKINLYKKILYPNIKFNIKESYLHTNFKEKKENLQGSYLFVSNNRFLIEILEKYYICNNNLNKLIKSNNIKINNYKYTISIENKHKEKIAIEDININNIKNHWFEVMRNYETINNKHTILDKEFIDGSEYKIILTKKEMDLLYKLAEKNNNISYLLYLLENLEKISEDVVSVYNPFTSKKISFKELKDLLTKQIILYLYGLIYNSY